MPTGLLWGPAKEEANAWISLMDLLCSYTLSPVTSTAVMHQQSKPQRGAAVLMWHAGHGKASHSGLQRG